MKRKHLRTTTLLAGILLAAARVQADPIALDTSSPNSGITVTATPNVTDPSASSQVTSLPYAAPTTETDAGEISTISAALTTSGFSLTYSQVTADLNASTDGSGQLFFVPGPKVTYTLSGTETSDDAPNNILDVFLYDVTTSNVAYQQDKGASATLTLDSTGGPLTGPLNSGDIYDFYAEEGAYNAVPSLIAGVAFAPDAGAAAPGLAGAVDITFAQTIPEPAAAALLLIATALATARRQHRRR